MKFSRLNTHNYEARYRYHAKQGQSEMVTKAVFSRADKKFAPHVSFDGDAEAQIMDHRESGGQFFMGSNHLSNSDVLVIGASMHKEPALQPFVGNSFVWAKRSLYQGKWKAARLLLDALGAKPVIRSEDLKKSESWRELEGVTAALSRASMSGLKAGMDGFAFPEGKRNRTDNKTELIPLQSGVGEFICDAKEELSQQDPTVDLALLPMAVWYREDGQTFLRVGELNHNTFDGRKAALGGFGSGISTCLEQVIELAEATPPAA